MFAILEQSEISPESEESSFLVLIFVSFYTMKNVCNESGEKYACHAT